MYLRAILPCVRQSKSWPVYPEPRRARLVPTCVSLCSLRYHCSLITAHRPPKLFRINTCKSLSKQTTLTPFRTYTYKKTGGRGVLWLTRFLLSSNVPTRLQPSFVFNRFHTLPSSVSCKSFAYHSYENCRVYTNNSHSGTLSAAPMQRGTSAHSASLRYPFPLFASQLSSLNCQRLTSPLLRYTGVLLHRSIS